MAAMVRRVLLLGLVAASVTSGSSLEGRSSYALKDIHPVPSSWSRIGRAPSDVIIDLQIGLQQKRFEELERHLYEVSDPHHARYGQHLTQEEVHELIKPTNETEECVHAWLYDHGIAPEQLQYSPARDLINLKLPLSAIERLLDTEYSVFVHKDGSRFVRTPQWSLPIHLHEHISTIQPTNSFFRPKPQYSSFRNSPASISERSSASQSENATISSVCDADLVTLPCVRTFYGTLNYTVKAAGKNAMALNTFSHETTNRSDAEILLHKYRPEAAGGAYQFSQISIANGTLQQTPDDLTQLQSFVGQEGALDSQTLLGIGWPTPLVAYSTGGTDPDIIPGDFSALNPTINPYLNFLQYVLAQPDLPNVISTSWGDSEQEIPYSHAVQICNMFAQLGARGVSVFWPSADFGVGLDGYCYNNDGTNSSLFLSVFPASCPYVTTVGATKNFAPEVAAADSDTTALRPFPFTSGGGFSKYFPRPSYQDSAISNYLSTYVGGNYTGLYNSSNRGYPDIAAQGQKVAAVWNGTVLPADGTSASTPLVAGIFTLVNDALIAAGRPPMGFLNPWIYQGGYKAFNDILSGSSAGCNTSGFPAAPGWDAVTGMGTPRFPDILSLLNLTNSASTVASSTSVGMATPTTFTGAANKKISTLHKMVLGIRVF